MSESHEAFKARLLASVPSIGDFRLPEIVPNVIKSIPSLSQSRAKPRKAHNSSKRVDKDFYPTPDWCIKGLMKLLQLKEGDVLLEPCIADGQIGNHFPEGHEKKWAEIRLGVDYLAAEESFDADVIITNPPFSLFMEFIIASAARDLRMNGTMCYLLRLSALGSKERADFWRLFPATHIITLTPRPTFTDGGTDNSEYAWICWDFGGRIKAPALWNIKKDEIDG